MVFIWVFHLTLLSSIYSKPIAVFDRFYALQHVNTIDSVLFTVVNCQWVFVATHCNFVYFVSCLCFRLSHLEVDVQGISRELKISSKETQARLQMINTHEETEDITNVTHHDIGGEGSWPNWKYRQSPQRRDGPWKDWRSITGSRGKQFRGKKGKQRPTQGPGTKNISKGSSTRARWVMPMKRLLTASKGNTGKLEKNAGCRQDRQWIFTTKTHPESIGQER